MSKKKFVLVDSSVLPEVFIRTLDAKQLLTTAQAKNSTEAAKMAGISRSAFYKYKDCVYQYSQQSTSSVLTIYAKLHDRPGVLSRMINEFYQAGVNILTVNQNIPVGGIALVSVSVRTDNMTMQLDELFEVLLEVDGIETIEQVSGH